MGHEIAHVAARHATRNATKGQLAQIGMIGAAIGIPYGWTGYAVQQGANLAIPMGFLAFSRAYEREADHLGLQYMYKAGYDPSAFVDFFEKIESLEKKKPGSVSNVFSSHPLTGDRIKAAQEEIQKDLAPKTTYVVNTSEFQQVKARVSMLHARRKVDPNSDPSRPTLRRAPGSATQPADGGATGAGTDDRPTLKLREPGGGN